jgi:DNA recombination protein RmuC
MENLLWIIITGIFTLAGVFVGLLFFKKNQGGNINDRLISDLETERARALGLTSSLAKAEAQKAAIEEKLLTREKDIQNLQKQFEAQFENLANRIFEKRTSTFSEQSEKSLSTVLGPLKEKIFEFQRKVEEIYGAESRERFALKEEIGRIVAVSGKMNEETSNLVKALKGDTKMQGNWGEMVLEKILDASGLREGEEYTIQARDLDLKDDEGRIQRPDIIVNLPDNKHLIIDAKLSLVSYEQHCSSEDDIAKKVALKAFETSLYAHVDGLAKRAYQKSEKLTTPDFVLLFIPIEGAFALGAQGIPEFFEYAWKKSIIPVGPMNLLAALKTVASIWKQERQTRNVLEIAEKSGKLYDKFVLFVEDLERIGKGIDSTKESFESAKSRLCVGRGNLVSKAEELKELGAKTTKLLPEHLKDHDQV